jgi:hypothetical protein
MSNRPKATGLTAGDRQGVIRTDPDGWTVWIGPQLRIGQGMTRPPSWFHRRMARWLLGWRWEYRKGAGQDDGPA